MADLPGVSDLLGDRPADDDGVADMLGPRPTPPPQGFQAGRMLWTGADADAFTAAAEPIGRVLRAFGQGAETAWDGGENLGYSADINEALKKAGVYPDVAKGQGGLLRAFNEGLIRPAVNLTFGLAGAFGRGLSAAVSGGQAGVAQLGEEVGAPVPGRDIAAWAEAFPLFGEETGGLHGVPALPRGEALGRELGRTLSAADVDHAAELGIIGPAARSSWQDTSYGGAVTATQGSITPEVRARVSTLQDVAAQDAAAGKPADVPLAPTDIHEAARAVAPETFALYDPLARQVDALREQIGAAQDDLRRQAEAQAPHLAEIADLQDRIEDATPRLAKKYQARLDALIPERDAFLADDFTMAALTRDTPEIAALREQLQRADYQMRDLAPDVTAAYREAARQFPETQIEAAASAPGEVRTALPAAEVADAPEASAEAPKGVSEPFASEASRTSPAAVEAAVSAPEASGEPVSASPAHEQEVPAAGDRGIEAGGPVAPAAVAPVSIREDVAGKLMAAGRPADEADAAGAVQEALWRTRAAAFEGRKGTAEEMYAREGADIRPGRNVAGAKVAPAPAKARDAVFAQKARNAAGTAGRTLMQASPVTRLTGEEIAPAGASLPDLRKAAEAYYDSELRKGVPAHTAIGDVTFTRTGRRHIRSFSADPDKLRALPAVRDILERGDYLGREDLTHPRKDGIVAFHRFAGDIELGGKNRRVSVLVNEDEYGNKFYDLNLRRDGADSLQDTSTGAGVASPEGTDAGTGGRTLKQQVGTADDGVNLHLSDARSFGQTTRGSIRLTEDGRAVITMFRDSNASTFIHETGHEWVERLLLDARDPDAPQSMRDDAATVRAYVGAADGEPLSTRAHEKLARSFERYLMEGVAPSRALESVFVKFKNWLTSIYQTVARLRAPITDDIRQVFDRMLATPAERAVIARDRVLSGPGPGARDLTGHAEPRTPYLRPGKEPTRLIAFLRRKNVENPGTIHEITRPGGLRDPGGDISSMIGGSKGMPGLINNATGRTISDALIRAWEHGYFPEHAEHWGLEDNDLLRKMEEDLRGNPQYSIHDQEAVEAYRNAIAHNAEVDRLASEHGIEPHGMSQEQFFDAVAEKLSTEEHAQSMKNKDDAHKERFGEAAAETKAWLDDHGIPWDDSDFHERGESRTLEDLEDERERERSAEHEPLPASESAVQGEMDDEPSVTAAAHQGPGEAGGGPRGRVAGDAGRDAEKAVEGVADTDSAERGAAVAEKPSGGVSGGGGPDGPGGSPHASVEEASDLVDKAGNIRLDNLNSDDDVKQALRDLARQHDDFMSARGGVISDVQRRAMADGLGLTPERFTAQKPDGVSPSVWAEAVQKLTFQAADEAARLGRLAGESGFPPDIDAYLTAKQRLLMIADHFSTLTAEAGRTLRVFDKAGMKFTGDLVAKMEQDTGRTLFQIQQEARAVGAMETTAQRAKMMQDTREPTRWQTIRGGIVSYFINNLISGPITHAAYAVGNTVTALFKAVPLTLAEATIDAARAAVRGEPLADRVHFGEAGAQIYGAMHGAWSGFSPGWKAFKTGISTMEGADRLGAALAENRGVGGRDLLAGMLPAGEALLRPAVVGPALRAAGVPDVIARPVGHVLETPSRAVSAIHTVFYAMNYEREIARRAFRAAANEGLSGDAFNTKVAELTQNPPLGIVQAAHDEAMRSVLMQKPAFGSGQQKLVSVINNSLPLKLAMPFMQIGMNILDEGLIKNTPLALASQAVRDDLAGRNGAVARTQAYARIIVGSGIAAGVMTAAAQGILTGAGPTDPRERALKEATGWKAYSIRIGDSYIPYRKYLGPLGPLVGGAASVFEVAHLMAEGQIGKAIGSATLGFAHTVSDETWMAGLANLVDAVTHYDTDGEKYLRNLALGFVPFSVGAGQVARLVDDSQREVHSWTAALRNTLPGLSEGLMPQRDWTGTPVGSHTMMSPSLFRNDRTMMAMEAAQFFPARMQREVRGVPLSDQQYDDLTRVAGGLAKMRMDMLVRTPGFTALPVGLQNRQMQQTLETSRKAGEDWLMLQPGNANIIRQANAAKGAQMQGRLPADVKAVRQGALPEPAFTQ